jgi:hypothetical protein
MKKIVFITSILLMLALLCACEISEEEKNMEGAKMIAVIKSIGDTIEVEAIEGDYGASGIYWVRISSDTVFADENNNRIFKSTLKVGDTIEITYNGQVMLSYPPQINAKKIQLR